MMIGYSRAFNELYGPKPIEGKNKMNKRIRELAEQAGIWKPTHDHKTWVRGEYISSPGELEKFAELIVVAVISKAEDYGLGCDAVEQLKKDFGVTE